MTEEEDNAAWSSLQILFRVFGYILFSHFLKMATISTLHPYNPVRHFPPPSSSFSTSKFTNGSVGKRGTSVYRLVVLAAHSNPKILKTNKKSRFGEALSPYDSDEDDEEMEDEDDDDDLLPNDWLSDVSFIHFDYYILLMRLTVISLLERHFSTFFSKPYLKLEFFPGNSNLLFLVLLCFPQI